MNGVVYRKAVNSSCIVSMGYSSAMLLLDVEFPSGAIYRYLDVPASAYAALLGAASKGAHFNRFIKHSFDFVRMEEPTKK